MLTGAVSSAGAVAPTKSGPMVMSGRGEVEMKTWAATSLGAVASTAAARARPPHALVLPRVGRHMAGLYNPDTVMPPAPPRRFAA